MTSYNNFNYHVIILAAGMSRRLAELTKEKPKSFLEIHGKKLIEYHLDILNDRGFKDVTIVVGYLKDVFMNTIGAQYKNLEIHYVIADDYETTGHSWSIALTKDIWSKRKKPALLIHADIFYHPTILDRVLESPDEDVIALDNHYHIHTHDECLVRAHDGIITNILFNNTDNTKAIVGEFIGINKWSPQFMSSFHDYLEVFFEKAGKNHNYEIVLNEFVQQDTVSLHYIQSEGLPWKNINYKEDYEEAVNVLYKEIYG